MKLVQIGAGKKSKEVLQVDENTFAELLDANEKFLTLRLTYSIVPPSDGSYKDYERVDILIDSGLDERISDSIFSSNPNASLGYKENGTTYPETFAIPQSASRSRTYPLETAQKVFAGRLLLDSLNSRRGYVEKITSYFSTDLEKKINKNFSVVDVVPLQVKYVLNNGYSANNQEFRSKNLVQYVNKHRYSITRPVLERVTSHQLLSDSYSLKFASLENKSIHKQLLNYMLLGIDGSPSDNSHIHYGKVRQNRRLSKFQFSEIVSIPSVNKDVNLNITFSLYRKGDTVPKEIVKKNLNLSRHYSAFRAVDSHISIEASYQNGLISAVISCEDVSNISKFNIYRKTISSNGESSSYQLVASVAADKHVETSFASNETLCVIRASSVDLLGKETGQFDDVVVGEKYPNIGSFSLFPYYGPSGDKIVLELFNIPVGTTKIFIYRRDCTENSDQPFHVSSEISAFPESSTYKAIDQMGIEHGNIFEYCAAAMVSEGSSFKNYSSNSCFLRHPLPQTQRKGIEVKMNRFSVSFDDSTNEFFSSFDLSSTVSKEEKEIITKTLMDQLGELYSQYLDPANNAGSPLGDDKYADLIIHEVVRTNLTTSEREVFHLIPDGTFLDNSNSQISARVRALNPSHSYAYQIFSYKKNPVLLFRDYVAHGIDVKGKEWFYSPYKWKQPRVLTLGKLYADDYNGKPIIDAYESMTSEPLGLTATKFYSGFPYEIIVKGVTAERIDRNTVLIRWESGSSAGDESRYKKNPDCFVVMKVVNGIRSFVGRTTREFIYHSLSEEDLGTVYYIVLPIGLDFSFGKRECSDAIFVDSIGIAQETETTAGGAKNA